jgi:hypothetical protein
VTNPAFDQRGAPETRGLAAVWWSAAFGLLYFRGCSASEQSFAAEMFVNIGPINSITGGAAPPVAPLRWRRTKESRKPSKRYGYSSPVLQVDRQQVLRNRDVLHSFVGAKCQNAHATKKAEMYDDLLLFFRSSSVHVPGGRSFAQAQSDPAKTCALIVSIYVNMRRLVGLVAEKVERIRPHPENCRHCKIIPTSNQHGKSSFVRTCDSATPCR